MLGAISVSLERQEAPYGGFQEKLVLVSEGVSVFGDDLSPNRIGEGENLRRRIQSNIRNCIGQKYEPKYDEMPFRTRQSSRLSDILMADHRIPDGHGGYKNKGLRKFLIQQDKKSIRRERKTHLRGLRNYTNNGSRP